MYGKLFQSMYDGTLCTHGPWQALVTFQQLIVLCDKEGVVDMTAEAISRRTTIPLEVIQTGIEALMQPDAQSRSPEAEGRRIVPLSEHRNWGWRLVNYAHYCAIRDAEERREYQREWDRTRRNRKQDNPTASDTIRQVRQNPTNPTHIDVDVDVDVKKEQRRTQAATRLPDGWVPCPEVFRDAFAKRPDLDPDETLASFCDFWRSKAGANARKLDWNATFRNWVRNEKPPFRTAIPTKVEGVV